MDNYFVGMTLTVFKTPSLELQSTQVIVDCQQQYIMYMYFTVKITMAYCRKNSCCRDGKHCQGTHSERSGYIIVLLTVALGTVDNYVFFVHLDGGLDLATVLNEVFCIRAVWYDIGVNLHVDTGTLESIKYECRDVTKDCLREVLRRWLNTGEASWSTLIQALRSHSVGANQLASTLGAKYCPELAVQGKVPSLYTMIASSSENNSFTLSMLQEKHPPQ